VSKELTQALKELAKYGDSYEAVVWRLIKKNCESKEDSWASKEELKELKDRGFIE